MNYSEIDTKRLIRNFICKNFLINSSNDTFSDEDSFTEKGIIDSTGVLEIVQFIQTSYGLRLNDNEIIPDNLDSIQKISLFIKKKLEIAS